ncbi:hypothetical protein BN1723_018503, partial [Verticillium longisporum]
EGVHRRVQPHDPPRHAVQRAQEAPARAVPGLQQAHRHLAHQRRRPEPQRPDDRVQPHRPQEPHSLQRLLSHS